ncbi:MAG: hypothetical protein O6928_04470 [Gammaproteobacteria bacterium]|nr:hypothetical protein [Gammaproteobacteria bacterium]
MAYKVRKVNYCYVKMSTRAGQGIKVLNALRDAGINLLAFSGFPIKGGKSQIDLVSDNITGIQKVAKANDWRLSKTKKGFLVQGSDEIGAIQKVLNRLAEKKISVIAADAVAAGKGRYGMIMWVNPKNYNRAARALNAK